ncbi:MAG TPA: NADH-quinone oxidoreductase subunit C, partial [Thermofilum sp.]|nr:NADH-quinone oxidoreductase subunit C [Thermofilum sp.]
MGARKIEETINAGIEDLRDTVRSYFDKGYNHIVTITGIDVGENIRLLYHMANMYGDLVHIATETSKKSLKVPTIIDIIPGAYIYEMEVHDLFGV